jgi:hypothetical protein
MAQRQIIGGGFQDALGNKLNSGYITFRSTPTRSQAQAHSLLQAVWCELVLISMATSRALSYCGRMIR